MPLNWSDYPNFSASEFSCKCGQCSGRVDMKPEFMAKLQALRNLVGPMRITSGFRCKNHPVEKRKKRGGAHSIGHAADIRFSSSTQLGAILSNAEDHGFKGCGIDKSFVHLDDNHPYLDRSVFKAWGY